MTNRKNIEDMYPLSPMQQGMLFHTLYAPESGVYFEQLICSFKGNFQIQPFQQAWQQVVARHEVLRTAFIWLDQSQPLQVVFRQVQLPLEIHDWRGVSHDKQHQQLSAFLQSDRERGFQLSQPPLMRLTLIQMNEDVYQFVLSHHHLLMDGWSTHLVFKEVLACYEACTQGQELHLEPTGRYRDYIAWLQKQDQAKAEGFWRQVLQGFTAPTPLIVDTPTSLLGEQAQQSKQQIWLSAEATADLQSFVRQHQLTLNTLVQASWALLLSRYSGEADVVFGVTVSGRSAAIRGVESVVGLLINTLPMRVLVRGDDSSLSWLKQIQNQQMEISQYEYSPLIQIHQMSEVPQGVPLFESIVVFENYPVDAALQERLDHLQVRDVHAFDQTNYPLTLVAVPSTQLSLQLGYDTHRFDAATTARMLGHLQTLLEEIVARPDQRLSDIPILSATEQQQLLVEWNDTKADYPQNLCIHQLFEAQVERTPDEVAVVFDMQQLTYQELNSRANRVAHHLQALGVQPEVFVGICVERSLEMIVGILGILKAGGAYVPLDPAYPAERLGFMLENTQARILLTQHSLVASLPEHETHIICLDSDWEIIAQQSVENVFGTVTPANLAYVIYTSGSTGQPKGVTIPHRSIVNRLLWGLVRYQLTPDDRVLQKTSFSFDVSLWEFFGPLLAGATLVMAELGGHQDPTYLVQVMAEQQITIVDFVPAMLQLLLEEPDLEACTALRYVTCGSEALPTEVRDHFFARLGVVELHNCYGPTEVSIDATYWICDRHSPITPIGRPIANQEVYILDAHLHPVPVGVPGELYVGGAGLARGYQNRPDWTAEKFIPHPFSDELGARLYKTGDVTRYLPDGNVEFLGRLDDQVKIRGFRIELGEIEAVLRRHPDIEETIVLVRDDAAANGHHQDLVAYLVPKLRDQLSAQSLRAYLSRNLPDYMLPATFVMLDTLPRTANGKVDRSRLIATELRPEVGITFVAPRTPIEERLAGIWAQVLGVEQVGIHDNFFELGGHSLLATQLISRVRGTLAVELPLRSLFEHPTVLELAECIERALPLDPSMAASPILPMVREIEIPLSFAQQRLWFLDQLEPGNAFYNIPAAVRLTGQINVAALEQGFNHIISRHEALRTNFATQDGQPMQVIAAILTLTLPVVNLQELPETSREIATQQLAKQEAVRPFNLASEPLMRAKLLQLSEAEHVLLLTMHHIITDGWSIGILVQELAAVYEALCNHLPPKLPELPIQYADFAMWQRQWLQGEVLEAQLAYWKQQLGANLPILQLPTARPRAEVTTRRGATNSFVIPSNLSKAIQALSRQEGVTLFMTLLASFQVLLQRYTNQDDIVVGTDVANRNQRGIEPLIGFFVNLLVLRTDLSGNPSIREFLKRVREVTLGAYAHQDLPFEKLVEALRPERNSRHTASLFQVLFVLQNAPMPALELPGLTLSPLEVETDTAKFDLALFLTETEQGIVGNWRYNADLFEPNTIARLSAHFEMLLKSIVAEPDTRINNLEMLTKTEKEQQALKTKQHKVSKIKKFMAVQPKAVDLSQERLIKTGFFQSSETFPLVITPNVDDIDIADWANNNQKFIEARLHHYGAILFRNFNIPDSTEFERFAEVICPKLFGEYGDLPREGISGKVYGSTPYPSDETILFHNESSHMHCWPQKIWFFCVQPAQQGGETAIIDSRKVFQLLNPKLREKFEQKQLMYVRNYIENLDVIWQDFFHTTDKAEVEEYCRKASISVEWRPDALGLRTSQVRPAVIKHPKTGEASFFNQIQLHHPFYLKSEVRKSLVSTFGEDNLPRHLYYGDRSPIEDSVLEEILAVYSEAEVSFPWQKGDVLMLDNMLVAHKRNPYVGPRKILVVMGQMIQGIDIEHKGTEKVYAN